ncbi:MAG: DNA polymerase IV [Planctomycetota bacterium]
MDRTIFHVDMDAFFAAIAVRDDPSLRGKAVLTGGTGKRGVVTTASYEARKYGCRSAMPMATALRLCPHAVCVKVPGEKIREASRAMFAVLDDFSPLVQPLSVDEAFLDMTGTDRLMGTPEAVARELKDAIFRATGGLVASVGVAPNKFLAKLASDLEKPDGLTVVAPDRVDEVLLPLPVSKIWGVGPSTQKKLERHRIETIADLRRLSLDQLRDAFGDYGERFHRLCRGIDDRPVVPDRTAKSIGHEQTFGDNLTDPDDVRAVLLTQTEQVAYRLRKHGLCARTVTVKLRYGDFETITRSVTLDRPTDTTETIWHAARGLFDRWAETGFRSVRLAGVGTSQFTAEGEGQAELFPDPREAKLRELDAAMDRITDRFGKHTVFRGRGQRGSRSRD